MDDKYKNLEFFTHESRCCNCGNKLKDGDSPWVVAYDPEYKDNVLGGDTYEFQGHLCQECAEGMAK